MTHPMTFDCCFYAIQWSLQYIFARNIFQTDDWVTWDLNVLLPIHPTAGQAAKEEMVNVVGILWHCSFDLSRVTEPKSTIWSVLPCPSLHWRQTYHHTLLSSYGMHISGFWYTSSYRYHFYLVIWPGMPPIELVGPRIKEETEEGVKVSSRARWLTIFQI